MKKIYDFETVNQCLEKCRYGSVLKNLQVDLFLIQYQKGELVTSPLQEEQLFQVIVVGSLNIYFIRDDGTRYSLSIGNTDYLLGDMDIFYNRSNNVFAEASEESICISFSIDHNKEKLLANNDFLKLICYSLSHKMGTITAINAASASLTERVLSYMQYKCCDGILDGLEQSAFRLHCSARQLQRVMNQCLADGIVKKLGKGAYQLIRNLPQ